MEDAASCNKKSGACIVDALDVSFGNAPVNGNDSIGILLIDLFTELFDPLLGRFEITLSSKAGIDGHDENNVYFADIRENIFDRCVGVNRNSGALSQRLDLIDELIRVFSAFQMESNVIGTCVSKDLDVFLGIGDHEMCIEFDIGIFSNRFDNRNTERNIVNVVAVHNIDMKKLSVLLDCLNVSHKVAEVCG